MNTNFQTIHQMGSAINDVVRQATGRDNVQNIDMDYVTVAQQRRLVEEIITGNPITINVNKPGLVDVLMAKINPVQNLNGYDKPWIGGGGKNLLDNQAESSTSFGITYTVNDDGTIDLDGTCTFAFSINIGSLDLKSANEYVLNGCPSGGGSHSYKLTISNLDMSTTFVDIGNGVTVTPPSDGNYEVSFNIARGVTFDNVKLKPMVRLFSETDDTYVPYSNICPISGRTSATITQITESAVQTEIVYTIEFPVDAGTVYGGLLTVHSDGTGTLAVDMKAMSITGNDISSLLNGGAGFYRAVIPIPDDSIVSSEGNVLTGKLFSDQYIEIGNTAGNRGGIGLTYRANNTHTVLLSNPLVNSSLLNDWKTWVDAHPFTIVYGLATPISYPLTAQQVELLRGTNTLSADTGDITVMYSCYEGVI